MRDHRQATRLVNQVNSTTQVDRVTRHMRRTSVSQEAVERLLSIPNMACLDQRVGDVRATDGGTVAHLRHDLLFADGHTKGGQLVKDPGEPTQPTIAYEGHLRGETGAGRISAVRQDMHAAAVTRARELHPAYHLNADSLAFSDGFIQPIERVVVSQSHDIEAGTVSLTHQLSRRIRPVRHHRMSMQVNPHTSDLSRCPTPSRHHDRFRALARALTTDCVRLADRPTSARDRRDRW